jgi:hypothetical protein
MIGGGGRIRVAAVPHPAPIDLAAGQGLVGTLDMLSILLLPFDILGGQGSCGAGRVPPATMISWEGVCGGGGKENGVLFRSK